jgi:general secretion pathway protein F
MAAVKPGFLPDLLAAVRSGEVSNQLPAVLRRASNALATQARIRREVRGALVYPGFLLGLSIAILLMIALYLSPTLLPVFVSSNVPPPAVLSALDALGQGLKSGWPFLLVLFGLGAIVFWTAKQRLGVAWQRIAWRIPLLGPHLKRQETLKMVSAIGLMLDSGATLLRAVATAREATDHPHVVVMLERAEQAITGGQTLSPVLEKAGLIDPMSMTLIMAGEEADSLPEAFEMVSRLLDARISQGITQAVKLITPILTLGLGLGVGSIILATVSAIMDMNDLAI